MIKDYKDLVVWQKSQEFCVEIFKVTKDFPRSELYGLVSQLNLAEGHTRQYTKEFVQFSYTALGSSSELESQLMASYELKYLDKERAKS